MYDKGIKEGMSGGHSQSVKAMYSGSAPQGDKFVSSIGSYKFQVVKDAGMGYSYSNTAGRVASSPMMGKSAQRSWRSSGSRSRANRSESGGMYS